MNLKETRVPLHDCPNFAPSYGHSMSRKRNIMLSLNDSTLYLALAKPQNPLILIKFSDLHFSISLFLRDPPLASELLILIQVSGLSLVIFLTSATGLCRP